MIVGVLGLARAQGAFALWGWLEVAAFTGAGVLPLLLMGKAGAKYKTVLLAGWALSITYVSLLALNLLRLGIFVQGSVRLSLWIVIAILLVRILHTSKKTPHQSPRTGAPNGRV